MADEPQQNSEETTRDDGPQTMPLAGYIAGGHVCRDLACSRCGYNLRTLGMDAACPECGWSVRRSMCYVDLRYADSGWLRLVSTAFLHFALVLLVLLGVLILLSCTDRAAPLASMPLRVGRMAPMLTLWAFCAWALAAPEPFHPKCEVARKATRVSSCLLAVVAFCGLLMPDTVASSSIAFTVLAIACGLNLVAIWAYASKLAVRIHTIRLHGDLRWLKKLAVIAFVIGLVTMAQCRVVGEGAATLIGAFAAILLLAIVIVWFEVCLIRMAIQLRRAAVAALGGSEVL